MKDFNKSQREPVTSWEPDEEALQSAGVRPGVYRHFRGGEYLTLTVGWRMRENGAEESVHERVVIYVALYDHPDYGPNAIWDRSIVGFQEMVELDGQQIPRFEFVRQKL